jgi:DNA polymerase-3 subunit epsilon
MDIPITLDRPLAFIDLETTGLSVRHDRIVELAVLIIRPTGDVVERVRRFNPGMPIPAAATEIHGITDQDVAEEEPFANRARSLAKLLADTDLAGFNIRKFDVPMLLEEFARAGVAFPMEGRRVIDAQTIFHHEEPRNLVAAARFYLDKDHVDAHSALGDIRISAHVLWAQIKRYAHLPRDIGGLQDYLDEARPPRDPLETWFTAWGDGDYIFRKGKHRDSLLSEIVTEAPGYLDWMLGLDDLPEEVREVVRAALARARGDAPR